MAGLDQLWSLGISACPIRLLVPMRILAIYPGHNASICILEDGRVLLNWELERFTRIKHDYGFRREFLVRSLETVGLSISDIDFICANRGLPDSAIVREGTVLRPFDTPETTERTVVPFRAELLGRTFDALAINHHLGHAACAFFTSPFKEAAIFTYDGYGDAENSSVGIGRGNIIEEFHRNHLCDLGGWWVSVAVNNYRMPRLHEWDPGSHSGKIMALAAYGACDPAMLQTLEEDMQKGLRGSHYPDATSYAFNDAEDLSETRCTRSQNLARALQLRTEREIEYQFRCVREQKPELDYLCYAGGLALNCIANSRALSTSGFRRLYVPPCPNDAGLALGMALYAHHHHLGAPRSPSCFSPYTGPAYGNSGEVFPRLASQHGLESQPLAEAHLVDILCTRELVCFFGSRSECGPRALGSRSILCLPDSDCHRDYLNAFVKQREWYRPYGPIVLAEVAAEVLEGCPEDCSYMTMAARIKAEWRRKLTAVNHVDHTTRPQILDRAYNPFLHRVLTAVYERTGIPALLNTSFNLHEPIVETPENAWDTFLALPVKYLATEDCIVRKTRGS
jgi:carbamoyltransferase